MTAVKQQPTLNDLAARVTELTKTFADNLNEANIPQVTFDADSPTSYAGLTPEMFKTRQMLLDALTDLSYLAQGPSESIFNYAHTVCIPPLPYNHVPTLTQSVHA